MTGREIKEASFMYVCIPPTVKLLLVLYHLIVKYAHNNSQNFRKL